MKSNSDKSPKSNARKPSEASLILAERRLLRALDQTSIRLSAVNRAQLTPQGYRIEFPPRAGKGLPRVMIVPPAKIDWFESRLLRIQRKQLKELVRVRRHYFHRMRLRSLNPFFHVWRAYRRVKRWAQRNRK